MLQENSEMIKYPEQLLPYSMASRWTNLCCIELQKKLKKEFSGNLQVMFLYQVYWQCEFTRVGLAAFEAAVSTI